jgi:hypothetical protein
VRRRVSGKNTSACQRSRVREVRVRVSGKNTSACQRSGEREVREEESEWQEHQRGVRGVE